MVLLLHSARSPGSLEQQSKEGHGGVTVSRNLVRQRRRGGGVDCTGPRRGGAERTRAGTGGRVRAGSLGCGPGGEKIGSASRVSSAWPTCRCKLELQWLHNGSERVMFHLFRSRETERVEV